MHQLGKCFKNVFIISRLYTISKDAYDGLMSCLQLLVKPEMKWDYLIFLETHTVPLRTPRELVQILQWLNGANDVESAWDGSRSMKVDWSLEELQLFRNRKCAVMQ